MDRVTDVGFGGAGSCGNAFLTQTQGLANALPGVSVSSVRALMTDGWGRPMLFDANEAEFTYFPTTACTVRDALISAGPDALFNSADDITFRIDPSGFCDPNDPSSGF